MDLQYTLNGLVNIERRSETYEGLKKQLLELETFLEKSEISRKA